MKFKKSILLVCIIFTLNLVLSSMGIVHAETLPVNEMRLTASDTNGGGSCAVTVFYSDGSSETVSLMLYSLESKKALSRSDVVKIQWGGSGGGGSTTTVHKLYYGSTLLLTFTSTGPSPSLASGSVLYPVPTTTPVPTPTLNPLMEMKLTASDPNAGSGSCAVTVFYSNGYVEKVNFALYSLESKKALSRADVVKIQWSGSSGGGSTTTVHKLYYGSTLLLTFTGTGSSSSPASGAILYPTSIIPGTETKITAAEGVSGGGNCYVKYYFADGTDQTIVYSLFMAEDKKYLSKPNPIRAEWMGAGGGGNPATVHTLYCGTKRMLTFMGTGDQSTPPLKTVIYDIDPNKATPYSTSIEPPQDTYQRTNYTSMRANSTYGSGEFGIKCYYSDGSSEILVYGAYCLDEVRNLRRSDVIGIVWSGSSGLTGNEVHTLYYGNKAIVSFNALQPPQRGALLYKAPPVVAYPVQHVNGQILQDFFYKTLKSYEPQMLSALQGSDHHYDEFRIDRLNLDIVNGRAAVDIYIHYTKWTLGIPFRTHANATLNFELRTSADYSRYGLYCLGLSSFNINNLSGLIDGWIKDDLNKSLIGKQYWSPVNQVPSQYVPLRNEYFADILNKKVVSDIISKYHLQAFTKTLPENLGTVTVGFSSLGFKVFDLNAGKTKIAATVYIQLKDSSGATIAYEPVTIEIDLDFYADVRDYSWYIKLSNVSLTLDNQSSYVNAIIATAIKEQINKYDLFFGVGPLFK
ncbi:MAG: hypothetical protein N3B21_00740 [Clostridia bacterium]|nr:hypothetical protein [Clostridia bacterium]